MAFDPSAGAQPYTTSATFVQERAGLRPGGKDTPQRDSPRRILKPQDTAERLYSALRDWRPIPAASPSPIRRTCSGGEDLPYQNNPTKVPDRLVSIGVTWGCVKRKSYDRWKTPPSKFS